MSTPVVGRLTWPAARRRLSCMDDGRRALGAARRVRGVGACLPRRHRTVNASLRPRPRGLLQSQRFDAEMRCAHPRSCESGARGQSARDVLASVDPSGRVGRRDLSQPSSSPASCGTARARDERARSSSAATRWLGASALKRVVPACGQWLHGRALLGPPPAAAVWSNAQPAVAAFVVGEAADEPASIGSARWRVARRCGSGRRRSLAAWGSSGSVGPARCCSGPLSKWIGRVAAAACPWLALRLSAAA